MAKRKNEERANQEFLEPSASSVGFTGCCPRCGQGRLFSSLLKPAGSCHACGLDYSFIDSGDGPAVFVILIIGFLVTAMAMALQASLNPPVWVHLLLWIPLILVLSLLGLRYSKGVMIALQYKTKAKEGQLGDAS